MSGIREIAMTEMPEVSIGNVQNEEAKTGVTVLLFDKKTGAVVGVDISGGGPASRETPLTSPVTADNPINAIVLSGGSAYGLAASDGVMRCLEDHGIGFETGYAKVPLVCQSCIYDLGYGSATVRPDSEMGYAACEKALAGGNPSSGSVGAGTGATVGKILWYGTGDEIRAWYVCGTVGRTADGSCCGGQCPGDIFDSSTGRKIAGLRTEDGTAFSDSCEELWKMGQRENLFTGNTTIGAVITNGKFNKAQMNKIASMTRNAYARCINPVGTMA